MPKVGRSTGVRAKSQTAFPVRKGSQPVLKSTAASPKKGALLPRSTSGTELRLRKAGSHSDQQGAPGPDPNKEDHMRILTQFDITYKYGPSAGVSRMERWNRAEKFGKQPPQEVKVLLLSHQNDTDYTEAIWFSMGRV